MGPDKNHNSFYSISYIYYDRDHGPVVCQTSQQASKMDL